MATTVTLPDEQAAAQPRMIIITPEGLLDHPSVAKIHALHVKNDYGELPPTKAQVAEALYRWLDWTVDDLLEGADEWTGWTWSNAPHRFSERYTEAMREVQDGR